MHCSSFRKFAWLTLPLTLIIGTMAPVASAQESPTVEDLSHMLAIQQNQIKKLQDELKALKDSKLNKDEAATTYVTKTTANSYLTATAASNIYLNKSVAKSTYQTIDDAEATFLTKAAAKTTYQTIADADASFLTKTAAADRYPSKAQVKNCALKMGVALDKDATQPTTQDIDRGMDNTWETFWFSQGNANATRLFFDWFCDF